MKITFECMNLTIGTHATDVRLKIVNDMESDSPAATTRFGLTLTLTNDSEELKQFKPGSKYTFALQN